jgi:hypothetical protein
MVSKGRYRYRFLITAPSNPFLPKNISLMRLNWNLKPLSWDLARESSTLIYVKLHWIRKMMIRNQAMGE